MFLLCSKTTLQVVTPRSHGNASVEQLLASNCSTLRYAANPLLSAAELWLDPMVIWRGA
jgi:hypothetical protein